MKILILSVTVGQGHNSCGSAVMSAFEEIGAECLMLDTIALSSKFVASSLNRVYIRMTRRNSKILRSIDDNFLGEDHKGRRKSTSRMIGGMGFAQKVYKAINAFKPEGPKSPHRISVLQIASINGLLPCRIFSILRLCLQFIGIMGERGRQTPCEILRPHGHKSHIHVPTVIDHVALINIRCQNAIFEGHILGRNQIGRFLIIIGKVSAHPVLKQRPS